MAQGRLAKKRLRSLIKKSKAHCCQELDEEVNADPWKLDINLSFEKVVLTKKNKKVSGPDGITAKVYKLVVYHQSNLRFFPFKTRLKEDFFRCQEKETLSCHLHTGHSVCLAPVKKMCKKIHLCRIYSREIHCECCYRGRRRGSSSLVYG